MAASLLDGRPRGNPDSRESRRGSSLLASWWPRSVSATPATLRIVSITFRYRTSGRSTGTVPHLKGETTMSTATYAPATPQVTPFGSLGDQQFGQWGNSQQFGQQGGTPGLHPQQI